MEEHDKVYLNVYRYDVYDNEDENIVTWDYPQSDIPVIDLERYETIGITSDSLHPRELHHIFLEWDDGAKLPPAILGRAEAAGILSKTKHGYHYIQDATLHLSDLVKLQQLAGCCPGFIKATKERGWACLRVADKNGEGIKQLTKDWNHSSHLYNTYNKLVNHFNPQQTVVSLTEVINDEVTRLTGRR